MPDWRLSRRNFLKSGLAGGCTLCLGGIPNALATVYSGRIERNAQGIPVRPLGNSGEKVSILCMGGHHIGRIKDEDQAVRFVRYGIDNGVTFIDNAWEYHRGRSEKIVGRALKGGYRNKAFVMTKIHGRDRKNAERQLDESLKRLGVDHVDLLQLHEVIYPDDPDLIFAPDGAIEVLARAKKSGKARFVGFTGHKDPKIHLDMLAKDFSWDAVQMPVNAFDPHFRSFIGQVLPVLESRGIAPLAMKTMGDPWLLKSGALNPREALFFAWSQPISTVVSGMDSMALLKQNMAYARSFLPLDPGEQLHILKSTAAAAGDGKWEKYKTSRMFDGPIGRKIHNIPLNS